MAQMNQETMGRYEVAELLGRGGMAEVYRAHDPLLARQVAIKLILPGLAAEENFERRFQTEARAVAKVTHPHIVQVFDFGSSEAGPFMVMEFVAGQTLKEKLKQSPQGLAGAEIVAIVQAIGAALDYAHSQGIIHRDVKPTNIMFRSDGAPMLTDFGIARVVDATQLTTSSSLTGTPAYLAPEQANGNPLPQSDLYSLGVVLFEMLTGRPPFSAGSLTEMVMKHVQEPPPSLQTVRPDLPAGLEGVLQKALAKKAEDRFQSGAALAEALRQAFVSNEAASKPSPSHQPAQPARVPTPVAATTSTHPILAVISTILGRNIQPPDPTQGKLGIITWVMGVVGALSAGVQVMVSSATNFGKAADLLLPYLWPLTLLTLTLGALVAMRVAMLWPSYRRHAFSAMGTISLVGCSWGGYTAYEQWRPPNGALVLVSRFAACEGETAATGNARSIYLTLRRLGQQLDPAVDARYDNRGYVEDGEARNAGSEQKAKLVIWGCERQNATDLRFDLLMPVGEGSENAQASTISSLLSFGYPLFNPQKLDHVTYLTLGLMRYSEGDNETAFGFFERAINSLGSDQTKVGAQALYFYRAMTGWQTGQPIHAVVADLETAKSFDSSLLEIRHNLSIAYLDSCTSDGRERLDEALRENEVVIKSKRSDALPYEVRGRLLGLQFRWPEAAASYAEALARGGDSPDTLMALAEAYRKAGNLTAAGETQQKIAATLSAPRIANHQSISTTAVATLLQQADAQWYAGDYRAAAETYQAAILQSQADKQPASEIGQLYLDQGLAWLSSGEWQKAATATEKALSLAPRYFGLQHKTGLTPYLVLGMAYRSLGEDDKALANFKLALQQKPCDSGAFFQRAQLYLQQDKLAEALADFQAAAQANPYEPFANFEATILLEQLNYPQAEIQQAYREAAARLTRFVENEPDNAVAHYTLALARSEIGDRPGADAARQAAIRLDPAQFGDQAVPVSGNALDLTEQANQAWLNGEPQQAIELAQQALALEPENALMWIPLGNYQLEFGELEAALETLGQATKLAPESALAYLVLSRVYYRLERWPETLDALTMATKLNPEDAQSWLQIANIRWRLRQLDAAVAPARRAVELLPGDPLVLGTLGMILVESGQFTQALPSLEQAVTISLTYEFAHIYLANAYLGLGRYAESINLLQTALTNIPTSALIRNTLTNAFSQQGERELALQNAKLTTNLLPDDLEAHHRYGYLLYQEARFAESIPEFVAALQLSPGLTISQLYLGYAYLAVGEGEKAAEVFKSILTGDFSNLYALAGMGYFYATQANLEPAKLEQAISYTERAAKLDTKNLVVQQAQAWIARVQGQEEQALRLFQAVIDDPGADTWHKEMAKRALVER